MQRINWFPDPNTTGTAPIGVANTKVDYPIVNGRKSRSIWRHCRAQRRKGWGLGVPASRGDLLVTVFRLAKRRADTDRVGDLHARRLGEIAVNGSDVVRRGHDAIRLTLMGVMA